jgi:hypothetical protein
MLEIQEDRRVAFIEFHVLEAPHDLRFSRVCETSCRTQYLTRESHQIGNYSAVQGPTHSLSRSHKDHWHLDRGSALCWELEFT